MSANSETFSILYLIYFVLGASQSQFSTNTSNESFLNKINEALLEKNC